MTLASYLAETSVLTRLTKPPVRAALQPFIDAVTLARCTLSDLEIGHSAGNMEDWDRLQAVLAPMPAVDITPAVVERAKVVQRLLAGGGLKGRKIPDLLIAAAAELNALAILHYDADFEIIASVTGQPQTWIVARGSID